MQLMKQQYTISINKHSSHFSIDIDNRNKYLFSLSLISTISLSLFSLSCRSICSCNELPPKLLGVKFWDILSPDPSWIFFSFSSWRLSLSSRFLANLLSGTGRKKRSVLAHELFSPRLMWRTNIADWERWHSTSSILGSGEGSLEIGTGEDGVVDGSGGSST